MLLYSGRDYLVEFMKGRQPDGLINSIVHLWPWQLPSNVVYILYFTFCMLCYASKPDYYSDDQQLVIPKSYYNTLVASYHEMHSGSYDFLHYTLRK